MLTTEHPPRRREFLSADGMQVLERARLGVLVSADGSARPMNFVLHEDALWFHTSPHSLVTQSGGATFTSWVDEAWIPSYWRHPRQACPATTYYTSVVARGQLRAETDLHVKARVLECFMSKYQPEGGYQRLDADDKLYAGPLAALTVLKMSLDDLSCKAKYGQHLSPEARQRVLDGLTRRGDWRTTELMRRHNSDLTVSDGFCGDGGAMKAEQIWALLRDTYWAHKRDLEIVERNRRKALAQWGYFEAGELRAYLRFEGFWLFDVIVHPDWRGRGLGKELLRRALADPKIAELPRLGLDTRDADAFYERFGFVRVGRSPGGSWIMIRQAEGESPISA